VAITLQIDDAKHAVAKFYIKNGDTNYQYIVLELFLPDFQLTLFSLFLFLFFGQLIDDRAVIKLDLEPSDRPLFFFFRLGDDETQTAEIVHDDDLPYT
jgi:hypothetical protein